MLYLSIDRNKPIPMIRQLYTELRTKILQREWKGGDKLPSTRKLAEELCVSRNVVVEAYEQLLAEGMLETRPGSGYFVVEGIYLEQHARRLGGDKTALHPEEKSPTPHDGLIDFRSGVPSAAHFPRKHWGKIAQQVCLEAPSSAFLYNQPEGRNELRQSLSRYLYRTRGVQCAPEQIIITSGATQALVLIAKAMLNRESVVLLEDPITNDIQTIFVTFGASLYPVPVDKDGILTDRLPSLDEVRPNLLFVTPSHQFPLGGTLPIQRRIALIQYARQAGCYIVEDDYDNEFRYDTPPISSLQGLDTDRVIYVGSFSKILSPALRLGYLVLPPELVHRFRREKWFSDLHTPALEQLTLSQFMEYGHLEKYVNRMKKLYKKRRQHVCDTLNQTFGDRVRIWGASAGLHIVAAFEGVRFTDELLEKAEAFGVRLYPVEAHAIEKGRHEDKVIIGYGNLTEADITEGIRRLQSFFHHALG